MWWGNGSPPFNLLLSGDNIPIPTGVTNLGKWPIKVGCRSVEHEVMLAEESYFPVILGRAWAEKRGVK